jgi:choice-of-anchor B domain-containing protein
VGRATSSLRSLCIVLLLAQVAFSILTDEVSEGRTRHKARLHRNDQDEIRITATKTPVHQNQCAKMMVDHQPAMQLGSLSSSKAVATGKSAVTEAIIAGRTASSIGSSSSSSMEIPVASCINGFASTINGNYPCEEIDLMSFLSLSDLNQAYGNLGDEGNDIWGWTDTQSGREFAIMGMYRSTAFVEITNPSTPIYKGVLPNSNNGGAYTGSSWSDIKTYNNHAYIVTESSTEGLQIFALTQLLDDRTNIQYSETAHYDGFGRAHNIVINEDSGYAYVVGSGKCAGGLLMIDLSNPTSPSYAGCYSQDGYTHDAHCVIYQGPDVPYQGKEICFACNEDTVTIVDVTDKNNPVQLARMAYTDSAYSHQGWLTENHKFFIFGDELDERRNSVVTTTYVADLRVTGNGGGVQNPSILTAHRGTTNAIDHNQYVVGDYLFQANYRAGLQLLHLRNLESDEVLEQVGHFDIYPSSNTHHFNGAWSVYPFFGSGNVVVSGIELGMFILRPNLSLYAPSSSPFPSFTPVMSPSSAPSVSLEPSGSPSGVPSSEPSLSLVPSMPPSDIPILSTITFDDFESGFGTFADGGRRATWSSNSNAPDGESSARVTDDRGDASSIFQSFPYDISTFDEVMVTFLYVSSRLDNRLDGFWLMINWDEEGFTKIRDFIYKDDFENGGDPSEVTLVLPTQSRSTARLKFESHSTGSRDYIYVDNVHFEGRRISPPEGMTPSATPSDSPSLFPSDVQSNAPTKSSSPSEAACPAPIRLPPPRAYHHTCPVRACVPVMPPQSRLTHGLCWIMKTLKLAGASGTMGAAMLVEVPVIQAMQTEASPFVFEMTHYPPQ